MTDAHPMPRWELVRYQEGKHVWRMVRFFPSRPGRDGPEMVQLSEKDVDPPPGVAFRPLDDAALAAHLWAYVVRTLIQGGPA